MSSRFEIFPEQSVVVGAIWGDVDAQTLKRLINDYVQSNKGHPSFDFLIDLTGVSDVRMSFADMQSFVDFQTKRLSERFANARTSVYAPDDLSYGFARMYVSISEDISSRPMAAFRSLPEALAFLDLSADPRQTADTPADTASP